MPRWALVFCLQREIEIAPSARGEFPGIAVLALSGSRSFDSHSVAALLRASLRMTSDSMGSKETSGFFSSKERSQP